MKYTRKNFKTRNVAGTRKQIGNVMGGKSKRVNQKEFDMIVKKMLEMLTSIKLYHWNTFSYSTHKATDSLHEELSGHVDKYVETMIGKSNGKYRINMAHFSKLLIKGVLNNNQMENEIKLLIGELTRFHNKLPSSFYSDVVNIKDEIVADLNKFLYLLTLKQ